MHQEKKLFSVESLYYLESQHQVEIVDSSNEYFKFDNKFYSQHRIKKNRELLRKWFIKSAKEKIIPRTKYQNSRSIAILENINNLQK